MINLTNLLLCPICSESIDSCKCYKQQGDIFIYPYKEVEGDIVISGYDTLEDFGAGNIRSYTFQVVLALTTLPIAMLGARRKIGLNILDAGCGHGIIQRVLRNTRFCRNMKPHYIGIDVSLKKLSKVQEFHYPYGRLLINYPLHKGIPLADNVIDICFLIDVIEHIDKSDGINLLKEIKRVSSKDAIFVLKTPNKCNAKTQDKKETIHKYLFELDELYDILYDLGFKNIKVYGCEIPKANLSLLSQDELNKYNEMASLYGKWLTQFFFAFKHPGISSELLYIINNTNIGDGPKNLGLDTFI